MYKGARSSPLLGIPPGNSSNWGAEGCEGGPALPPSLCTSSNGSCGFSLQRCSPWDPLFARLKGGTCTMAAGTGLSFSSFFPRVVLLAQAHRSTMEQREH